MHDVIVACVRKGFIEIEWRKQIPKFRYCPFSWWRLGGLGSPNHLTLHNPRPSELVRRPHQAVTPQPRADPFNNGSTRFFTSTIYPSTLPTAIVDLQLADTSLDFMWGLRLLT